MTGHAIKDGRPVCLEPETAQCRARWDYQTCGCESYSCEAQLPDGRWTHVAYDPLTDDDVEHVSVGHYDARDCNVCNWLNDDLHGTGPGETWAWGVSAYDMEWPDGAITETWEGDFYTWDYTEPRVIGGLIGRLEVARWADEIGLAS